MFLFGSQIPAASCHMHLVATDWLTSRERIDHVAARPDSCVQFAIQKARKDPDNPMPFFLIVNLQVTIGNVSPTASNNWKRSHLLRRTIGKVLTASKFLLRLTLWRMVTSHDPCIHIKEESKARRSRRIKALHLDRQSPGNNRSLWFVFDISCNVGQDCTFLRKGKYLQCPAL